MSLIGLLYSSDTLTMTSWHALELLRDFDRRRTHFVAVTIRRRTDSTNPRTLYSLIDCEVLPRTLMEEKYANVADLLHHGQLRAEVSTNPLTIWDADEVERKTEWAHVGALGSCMVVTMELPEGDNRSVTQAFMDVSYV